MLITPGLCLMLSTAFRRLPTLEKNFVDTRRAVI